MQRDGFVPPRALSQAAAVVANSRQSGAPAWRSKSLSPRRLAAGVANGTAVAWEARVTPLTASASVPRTFLPVKADIVMRRTRRGFTLIELLIVVVIIGVLAAIAIPKFQSTKGKANAATLKSDLRNLATAQEAYFYEHLAYTTNVASLNVSLSTGVTITWGTVGTTGWSAKLTHPLAYPIECAMFMGAVPALAPATVEGQLVCQ